ncbi:MAG: hypothetical protein AAGF12_23630 [Myxococcota bacterium]
MNHCAHFDFIHNPRALSAGCLAFLWFAGCADSLVGPSCGEGFALQDGVCVAAPLDGGLDGGLDGSSLDAADEDARRGDVSITDGLVEPYEDGGLDGSSDGEVDGVTDGGDAAVDGSLDGGVDGAVDGSMGTDGSTDGASDGAIPDGGADGATPDGGADSGLVACDIGELQCGGVCIRPDTDPNHCGGCGNACGPTELCASGMCVAMCPVAQVPCGGSCIDPLGNDPDNCGGCNVRCASGICSAGVCTLATAGHVMVVGHDYQTNRVGMNRIAGNSVFIAPGVPVRVLAYHGSASLTSIRGIDAAVNQVAAERGRSWTKTVSTEMDVPVDLASSDAFIIYPQAGGTDADMVRIGTEWSVALASFLGRGGVIVLFETRTTAHAGTHQILGAASLFSATSLVDITSDLVDVVAPLDSAAVFVPLQYRAEDDSVRFVTTVPDVVVAHVDGPVVLHRVVTP